MEYRFRDIEKKWQAQWKDSHIYKVSNESAKPKCYVLDMFPYPSGAGLHVGHPLGYIASDIYSRYKRLKGFNVLHPMGFDSFGLPAEQYALDTGQHPAITTKQNIETFKSQLNNIGFSYDWSRELQTSDPKFYKWTQWIFLQLFSSFYNRVSNKAESIDVLVASFEKEGNHRHVFPDSGYLLTISNRHPDSHREGSGNRFSAEDWRSFDEKTRQDILMQYRLTYCGYGEVNWCEALGTVLANDEVVNGVSERGGYPVEKKRLRQWYLRITEYAERLLEGLEKVEFSEAMKEMQTNWIGKSEGAEVIFSLTPNPSPGGEGDASPQPSPGGEGESPRFFQTADKKSWVMLKAFGRSNRKNSTEAENILWQRLRNNKMGVKVRRQHTVGGYIADFVMLEVRLVIEVDGEYHNDEEQKLYDIARTGFFNEFDLHLIRFTNDQVIKHTEDVINEIGKAIEDQKKKIKEKNILKENSGEKKESPHKDPSPPGEGKGEAILKVYTTRPDTIYGVDFMVIAPEHDLVTEITTREQKEKVDEYIAYVKSRSERERIAEKKITGVFTGAYAVNPFDGREIPIWISEYVLAGYGTGAIMGVPCGDERDHKFAKHFNIPITNIIGSYYNGEQANPTKEAILENSGFLNGMVMKGAIDIVIKALEERGIGVKKTNYKMRDAAFSRQRYWGEPFPIVWKNGIAYPLDEKELPLELPHVDSYSPGPDGEGPLANIKNWAEVPGARRETNTMPGYAGSSWYFLRYMDPHNDEQFCNRKCADYWNQVDLYIGGTEHAVGHLLYSRMWTKFLFDTRLIGFDEPYKRLVNQGMIQGSSRFVYRIHGSNQFVSAGLKDQHAVDTLHVDVNMVDGLELDIEAFRKWKPEYANAEFILENGELDSPLSSRRGAGGEVEDQRGAGGEVENRRGAGGEVPSPRGEGKGEAYICGAEVEKMSKSKFNTVNPDDLVARYGADTFRMYEMFLGPVEMSKPWDTKGIEGVHRFLKKFWRMFSDETYGLIVTDDAPNPEELKVLHHAIKKIESDTERFSFNTAVSAFMIATNELTDLKCHKRAILEPLLVLLAPYAPHISEELWSLLGNKFSILDAEYPRLEEKYIKETSKEYPVAINGKTRTQLMLPLDISQHDVETIVLNDLVVRKWLEDKKPKKIIYVKNKMINVVV